MDFKANQLHIIYFFVCIFIHIIGQVNPKGTLAGEGTQKN
jgi:hypothetical protein